VRDVIDELLVELTPTAKELGCADELHDVRTILDVGAGYVRQRQVVDRGGSLVEVVDRLIDELEVGSPLP
jgi:carboxylate-amine ligase